MLLTGSTHRLKVVRSPESAVSRIASCGAPRQCCSVELPTTNSSPYLASATGGAALPMDRVTGPVAFCGLMLASMRRNMPICISSTTRVSLAASAGARSASSSPVRAALVPRAAAGAFAVRFRASAILYRKVMGAARPQIKTGFQFKTPHMTS